MGLVFCVLIPAVQRANLCSHCVQITPNQDHVPGLRLPKHAQYRGTPVKQSCPGYLPLPRIRSGEDHVNVVGELAQSLPRNRPDSKWPLGGLYGDGEVLPGPLKAIQEGLSIPEFDVAFILRRATSRRTPEGPFPRN
jgi:hypothetical protein